MIDSGSSRDLIKPSFAKKFGIPTVKCEPYVLTNFDGIKIGTIDVVTKKVPLRIGRRIEKRSFDLVPRGVDDITLGAPWLRETNPLIGWQDRMIRFADGMTNRVSPILDHDSFCVVA